MRRSSLLTGSGVYNSVNRLRTAAGRSRFPASVAGFIAASRRKLGCRPRTLTSPRSASVMLPFSASSSPAMRSRASGGARLISSSNSQQPRRSACTSAPSTKAKANPPSAAATVRSAAPRASPNAPQSSKTDGAIVRRFFFVDSPSEEPVPDLSLSILAMAARNALVSCSHLLLLAYLLTRCRKSWLSPRGQVLENSSWKRVTRGISASRASTGRKPPSRSLLSVCWLRFSTTSSVPVACASCCTMVVLPVPVSPTSKRGSFCCSATATRCSMRIALAVQLKRPCFVEEAPEPARASAAHRLSPRGRTARPTVTWPFPTSRIGLPSAA
mmetsp:Transcript_36373/g.91865  ORF Transcript_36373/g.91865 Transcript_36373/m.91865 type:complete len:328 (-) Transcript_36373:1496-2479(-)